MGEALIPFTISLSLSSPPLQSAMECPSLSEMVYPELKTTLRLDYNGTSNFRKWKREVEFIFIHNRVSYVFTNPKPPEPSDEPTETDAIVSETTTTTTDTDPEKTEENVGARYHKWIVDDFTARHIILGAIADEMYLQFHSYPTAKSLMDALTARFNSKSMSRRLMMLNRYLNHCMSEDTDIMFHITKMETLALDLKMEGVPIPGEFQAVMLMNSLPESWYDTVTILNANMLKEDLNMDNVRRKVRDAGRWKEVFKAQSKEKKQPQRLKKGGLTGNCYGCGNFGHYVNNCPSSSWSGNR